tara:strand:+ start:317 stop:1018 length:702 start_codon:yes stop_codon:yes gene_type:complete
MLSSSGICSRRQAESLIKEGRLTVNNEISHLGQKIDHNDLVRIDGKIVDLSNQNSKLRVLMYNKDLGEISSKSDPESRKTIFDSLPKINGGNWFSVGRLDINTSGLILFTNKGDFANQLMHPSSEIEREYVARIRGDVKEKNLEDMINGVQLEDGIARFTDIQPGRKGNTNQWFAMVIIGGKNREVRRLWESQGFEVSRLKRVRFGGLFLPSSLKRGEFRELKEKEIKSIEHQ